VAVGASQGQLYSDNLGTIAPGLTINRGFVRIDATIDGLPFTVASTHLESGSAAGLDLLRAAQAAELGAVLASAPRAAVLGDLNDGPGSPMHQALLGAGFTDVWAALHPGAAGYTCCHLPDLSNQTRDFDQRIDYVLVRGVAHGAKPVLGRIDRTGDEPAAHVAGPAGGIWPSDHAGLVAELLLPPSRQADQ
jgi:endonuclease/exonuclease/phosphatase family metal-dependent hydrolase